MTRTTSSPQPPAPDARTGVVTTAVDALWREFREALWAFIRARVPDDHAADDVLQAAFLRMHRALEAGGEPEQPRAWVHAVTRSALTDHYRAEASLARRHAAATGEGNGAGLVFDDLGPAPALEDEADVALELARCVRPLLGNLEDPYREALEMTTLEGVTQSAAAERLGISVSGMKSRVQRGRRQLRDVFERCCAIELDARGRPIDVAPKSDCGCGPED